MNFRMRFIVRLAVFMISLAGLAQADLAPATAGSEGQRAFDDLGRLYRDRIAKPPFEQALADIKETDEERRYAAGRYLVALFAQSLADEMNGRAEWPQQVSWSRSGQSQAREFRETLGAAFGREASGEEGLDVVLWLIKNEPSDEIQDAAEDVLPRIQSPRIEQVLTGLLDPVHPNSKLAVKAIEEASRRRLTSLALPVSFLCNHYRIAVREAARKAASELGIRQIPEFDPGRAFTPSLKMALRNFLKMASVQAPPDAAWYDFKRRVPGAIMNGKPMVENVSGWLLTESPYEYEVLTWFGTQASIPKRDTSKTKRTLADVAREIGEIYADKDVTRREALSERGAVTAQFEHRAIGAPAALVSAWCMERGDRQSAAALLFPRLQEMQDDRWLTEVVRDQIAGRFHQSMLEAFCHDRNYAKAIKLADHLSDPVFDGYNYQSRAKNLAAQLRARMDDFKTFKLPMFDEWQALSRTMKREDQIRYLAARLRLLNCVQDIQPGGIDYDDPQFADAHGMFSRESKSVINPFSQLKALQLTVAELPLVLPYLAEDTYCPTFSYWRDFHPSRALHQVNWVVAELVNAVANRDLVMVQSFPYLDEAGRKRRISEIEEWCRANAGKNSEGLLIPREE